MSDNKPNYNERPITLSPGWNLISCDLKDSIHDNSKSNKYSIISISQYIIGGETKSIANIDGLYIENKAGNYAIIKEDVWDVSDGLEELDSLEAYLVFNPVSVSIKLILSGFDNTVNVGEYSDNEWHWVSKKVVGELSKTTSNDTQVFKNMTGIKYGNNSFNYNNSASFYFKYPASNNILKNSKNNRKLKPEKVKNLRGYDIKLKTISNFITESLV